jgi:hypothetical protein
MSSLLSPEMLEMEQGDTRCGPKGGIRRMAAKKKAAKKKAKKR